MGIRTLLLFACIAACSSNGRSPDPLDCEHTQSPDSKCCLSDENCTGGQELCAPPGASFGCGVCNTDPTACGSDAECRGANPIAICVERTCGCSAQRDCVPGCTSDAGCGIGQSCNLTTNRCAPTECTTTAACPQDFGCIGNRCLRKGCITSSDCDGFCVDGLCYQEAGECRAPAA